MSVIRKPECGTRITSHQLCFMMTFEKEKKVEKGGYSVPPVLLVGDSERID